MCILNLSTGEAVAAVFSAGSDTQVTPVPARSFRIATWNKILVNADKKTLKGAPGVPKTELSHAPELGSLSRSFTYFNQETPKMSTAGKLASATRLFHQELRSQDNEPLGQVEDIVVDLPAGNALYLLIKPTTAAEVQKALYAVLPQSVQPDATGHALVLRASRGSFPRRTALPTGIPDRTLQSGIRSRSAAALCASGSVSSFPNCCLGAGAPSPRSVGGQRPGSTHPLG